MLTTHRRNDDKLASLWGNDSALVGVSLAPAQGEAGEMRAMVRFDRDKSYGLGGDRLNALTAVSAMLNDEAPMPFEKRRNLANLIDLVLMEAVVVVGQLPESQ